jgi:hypothetical protein
MAPISPIRANCIISSPNGIEPLGASRWIGFISTSFAGDAVLLFIDVDPEVVPAGLLPSVSGDDVEAMCAERMCCVASIVVGRRGERTGGPPDTTRARGLGGGRGDAGGL